MREMGSGNKINNGNVSTPLASLRDWFGIHKIEIPSGEKSLEIMSFRSRQNIDASYNHRSTTALDKHINYFRQKVFS